MKKSEIRWGLGNSSVLTIGYPVDNLSVFSQPRNGSEFVQTMGGVEDAWITGVDYYLDATIRWIPNQGTASATGWQGSQGWDAFLRWARDKRPFIWVMDVETGLGIESTLVEPLSGGPGVEMDGTKSIRILIRNPNQEYSV